MKFGTLLIIEDDAPLREALQDTLKLAGYEVITASEGGAALEVLNKSAIDLVISDIQMDGLSGRELLGEINKTHPGMPVILMTAYGTIAQAVEAMKEGAADYLVKPFEAVMLLDAVKKHGKFNVDEEIVDHGLIAHDHKTLDVIELAKRVAKSEATVMITGDSGTGKEMFARYIHRQSSRSAGPFVAINCAAIPENMLEAMLFGYEKGAYTGAHQSAPGKFEQAQDGTLLLDEISEMGLGLQAKILRVLQEREVERLGSRKTVNLNVRVLATSNRNLRSEVTAGRFREDLYYRLHVFPLYLPRLKERVMDIMPLAKSLLKKHCMASRDIPRITLTAQTRMMEYPWPGNVRELDNVMQRALILCDGAVIDVKDLCFEQINADVISSPLTSAVVKTAEEVPDQDSLGERRRDYEARMIIDAIRNGIGNRNEIAAKLGISPRTLRYKLAQLRESGLVVE